MQSQRQINEIIENKTREIKLAMGSLGRRLEQGDNSQLLYWVIPDQLACAHRPLRHHPLYGGSGKNLSSMAAGLVHEWAEEIVLYGIKSIISLMHDRDLNCYSLLDLGATSLLEYYEKRGLVVAHIPWEDPHHKKSGPAEKRKMLLKVRKEALSVYQNLPKPVLIQCSAGIDRSSPVAAFIWSKIAETT